MRNLNRIIGDAKRIAIMGGTFDPIHYGHLVTAEAVRHAYDIDFVLFVPTGAAPHKQTYDVTDSEHRYLMTVLATSDNPFFIVSRLEIDRPGMSYTIDTVRALRERCPADTKIYFITGADAVHQILTWKDAETLLGLCSFIAVTRPGYNSDKLYDQVEKIKAQQKSRIHFLEVPALAISSSDIRDRILVEKPIKYLLPENVAHYIARSGLYQPSGDGRGTLCGLDRKTLEKNLRKALSDKRYIHTQGVAEVAVKLAWRYDADKDKTLVAALLHDCAKCMSNSQLLKYCKEYDIVLDAIMQKKPTLAHGFVGAAIANRQYQIADDEILNAIRYHTTGRAGMSLIEKIVYVADCIEPNRDAYPGLDTVRRLAYSDLNQALYEALKNTISENKAKDADVHPLSYEALDDIPLNG